MILTLGFSPCPNDTFIFDAMIHGKIDTEGLDFEVIMDDVEALNRLASKGEIDITKLSYHAFAHMTNRYNLLNAGSALGNGCGPLLVAKNPMKADDVNQACIAIPGALTTANFLMSYAFPEAQNKEPILFSDIETAVLEGRADAGVIIHENRFTYEKRGLIKIIDLGEHWEKTTGLPIPLGGIVVNKTITRETQLKIDRVLHKSIVFAFENTDLVMPFVKKHAQEMSEEVMMAHIKLYVNAYTLDLGPSGKKAVTEMMRIAQEKQLITDNIEEIFLN